MKLTIWERVMLFGALGSIRGRTGLIRLAIRLMDQVELSKQEKLDFGFSVLPDGSFGWKEDKKIPIITTVDFDEEELGMLQSLIDPDTGWDGWPADNKRIVSLFDKIEATKVGEKEK